MKKRIIGLVLAVVMVFGVVGMSACCDCDYGGVVCPPVEREWGYSECGRFALSIWVEETTLPQGEDFAVNVKMKNISDEDYMISYGTHWSAISSNGLFLPQIENWCFFMGSNANPPIVNHPNRFHLFKSGAVFYFYDQSKELGMADFFGDVNDWYIGGYSFIGLPLPNALSLGIHNLTFMAIFSIGTNRILLSSNMIELIVI